MKKWISLLLTTAVAVCLSGCGTSAEDGAADTETSQNLEGSLTEILATVYEKADLSQDFRDSMKDYDSGEITAETAEYMIGTTDVEYTEAIYSVPLMNVVPYQCILLRLPEGADVEAAKQTLSDNADPRKWICVEAESVIVENVGDVILFLMADTDTANAMRDSFLALGQ